MAFKIKSLGIGWLILLLPLDSWAQKIDYGLTLGSNISDHTIRKVAATTRRIGINAGIRAQLTLSPDLHLHASAVYSQKGSSLEVYLNNVIGGPVVEDKLRLNYIDFPLLISRSITFIRKVQLYPMIGIQPSILVYAINEVPREENNQLGITRTNLFKDPQYRNVPIVLNKNDFGLTGGISGQYNLINNLLIFLDIRYAHSLNPVFLTSAPRRIVQFRNHSLSINTGLMF